MNKECKIYLGMVFFLFIVFSMLAFLGVITSDPMHYIATTKRFYLGDAMLTEDWSAGQTETFLLLPFYCIYVFFVKSTDGIMLYYQLLYEVIKLFVVVYGCYRFNKKSFGSLSYMGLISFMIFCPYNENTLSYNTIPMFAFFIVLITMMTHEKKQSDYFLYGLMMGIAIIAQPFCIVAALAIFIVLLISVLNEKKYVLKSECLFILGGALVGTAFLLFVFSRSSIHDVMSNITYILGEPDHNMVNQSFLRIIWEKLLNAPRALFSQYFPIINIVNIAWMVVLFFIRKKRYNLLVPTLLVTVISLLLEVMVWHVEITNYSLTTAGYLCLDLLIIYKDARVYLKYILLTFIMAFCVMLGTNTGMQSPVEMMIFMLIIAFVIMGESNNSMIKKESLAIVNILLVVMICLLMLLRTSMIWQDGRSVFDYTCKITEGPYKGTWITPQGCDYYQKQLRKYDEIDLKPKDRLFVAAGEPMAYLYLEADYATFGTPFYYLDYNRLYKYYELHPDKFPTVVYYPNVTDEDKKSWFWEKITENCSLQSLNDSVVIYINSMEENILK